MENKLASATEKLNSLKESLGGADTLTADQQVKLRTARKKQKRAQRRLKLGNTAKAKTDGMEQKHQQNIEKTKEKAAKKEQAKESALTAAAEKQAKEKAAKEEAAKEEAAKEEATKEKPAEAPEEKSE